MKQMTSGKTAFSNIWTGLLLFCPQNFGDDIMFQMTSIDIYSLDKIIFRKKKCMRAVSPTPTC